MKTEMVKIRVSEAEKKAFEIAAELAGIPVSAWIRERLRTSSRRELAEAGQQIPFLQKETKQNG